MPRVPSRLGWQLASFVGALVIPAVFTPTQASAQTYTRIEQDWTIIVGAANSANGTPQIALQMKPDPALEEGCLFLLNYSDQPSFTGGGTQVQIWNGTTCLNSLSFGTQTLGKQVSEKLTFTMYMQVDGTNLTFGYTSLKSWSWGNKNNVLISVPYTATSLPNYVTSDSASNSVIMVGSAQVTSMTINAVRFYNGNTQVKSESITNVFP